MSNLDDDDIDMMMTVSHFVTTLTRTQRDLLGEVLSKTTEATRRQYAMEMQTKQTGKLAVRQSIPVPKIIVVVDIALSAEPTTNLIQ